MGLFDKLFKKSTGADASQTKKCSECFRQISGYAWKIDNKDYCQECYNRRMAIVQQTAGRSPEEYDFEMTVEDVFLIKNHGVVLTGKIKRGVIHRNDIVTVNNTEYTVTLIDAPPNKVEYAKEGANVGIHLSTMEAGLFKHGDVVTSKCFEEKIATNTFICDSCKKEFAIKYRHKGNICVECAKSKKSPDKAAVSPFNIENANQIVQSFGTTVPDEYIKNLKKYAVQFIPGPIDDVSTQRKMIGMVKPIFPIEEFMLGMQIQSVLESNSLGELSSIQLQGWIAANIDKWLGGFKKEAMLTKIRQEDTDVLLRCWIVLTFYCDILKTEYSVNLKEYYMIILTEIYNRGYQIPTKEEIVPVQFVDSDIHIDSNKFIAWKRANPAAPQIEVSGSIPLTEKTPTISLYEDEIKTRDYCLQTEEDENFTGKYFLISVRLGVLGNPAVPVAQIDGFVSDTPNERRMTMDDVGYRMEGHFLACGGEAGKQRYEMNRGQDLPMKALKYQGYTTPSNVRLIGVCPDCGKSFTFRGYAFYMGQSDVAYSDDGLDCCEIQAYDIDKDTWSYETDGKTFRYYNSFNCPHCGTPYIDYKKYPENKVFGVSGCVHLGRKPYRA